MALSSRASDPAPTGSPPVSSSCSTVQARADGSAERLGAGNWRRRRGAAPAAANMPAAKLWPPLPALIAGPSRRSRHHVDTRGNQRGSGEHALLPAGRCLPPCIAAAASGLRLLLHPTGGLLHLLCVLTAAPSPAALPDDQVELAKLPPLQRIPLLARYARIFAAELFGTVLAVPFGLRAFSLHRSLPDARQQRAGSSVSILRDVRCEVQGMGPCRALSLLLAWRREWISGLAPRPPWVASVLR